MEEMSWLVERLGVDHIDDEDKPKYKANQHEGGGDRQHESLLLLLLSLNNCIFSLYQDGRSSHLGVHPSSGELAGRREREERRSLLSYFYLPD